MDKHKSITKDEIVAEWCSAGVANTSEEMVLSRLLDILTGEYPLDEAREDVLSFRKDEVA